MAKFNFHLQSLLDIREKKEEDKKNEFGKAIGILEDEKGLLNILLEKEQKIHGQIYEKLSCSIDVSELKMRNQYISYLDKQKTLQHQLINKAQQNVDIKREELLQVVKEKRMIEVLKEKAFEDFKKQELLQEQKNIDELISFKYKRYSSE